MTIHTVFNNCAITKEELVFLINHLRPGATKGTLRRKNENSFFDELCLIIFHWSFENKIQLSSPIFDKVMVTSMFRN